VTLYLLADPGIAGEASWGYWLLVLATWLGAALTLTRLAALRATDRTSRTLQDLAIPVLFGAFLVYLWEVAVRGFGVSRRC
jgi:NitT/TauT family transport system permease protein